MRAVDRRSLLLGAAASAALAALPARAAVACLDPSVYGRAVCEAGVEIGEAVTARQRCAMWCWAACIESVFALSGHRVPQDAIVERLFGAPVCAPANGDMIVAALSGEWRGEEGRPFRASADVLIHAEYGLWRDDAASSAIADLKAGRPLILGAFGHAVLLTAVAYDPDTDEVLRFVIRDPWPGNPNRRIVDGASAASVEFLARVGVV